MNDEALDQFQRFFSHQEWDAAQRVAEEAVRENPDDWNAIYLSGIIHRFKGDFQGAIAQYKRALQLNAADAAIWQALGVAYQQAQNYQSAIEALTHAAQLQPANYEVHTSLGITHSYAGDFAKAMQAHERALEICVDRAFAEILRDRDKYFSTKNEPDGRVLKLNPAYFTAMKDILVTDFRYFNTIRNMAACCMDFGDHKRANALMNVADTCTPIEADLIGPIKRSAK